MEQFGTGIQRMIKKTKEYGLPDPEFSHKSGCFIVTLKQTDLTSYDQLKWQLASSEKYLKENLDTDHRFWGFHE